MFCWEEWLTLVLECDWNNTVPEICVGFTEPSIKRHNTEAMALICNGQYIFCFAVSSFHFLFYQPEFHFLYSDESIFPQAEIQMYLWCSQPLAWTTIEWPLLPSEHNLSTQAALQVIFEGAIRSFIGCISSLITADNLWREIQALGTEGLIMYVTRWNSFGPIPISLTSTVSE